MRFTIINILILNNLNRMDKWHTYCYLHLVKKGNIIMIRYQRTIKNNILCNGIGLHTGKNVQMTLKPASAGAGVVFIRTDLANTPDQGHGRQYRYHKLCHHAQPEQRVRENR